MSRVLIVGAGPAGIRAAETLSEAGLSPIIVDEAARAGGQVYRRAPPGFQRGAKALYGSEAGKATALHQLFDRLVGQGRVVYHPQSSVLSVSEGRAQVLGPAGLTEIPYDGLILATGAMDRVMPVPGWQSAGVFSLGAAQIALKSQGCALGSKIVLMGSGPLLTLVAWQLQRAGAQVQAVLETAPMRDQVAGGVHMARARPLVTFRGMKMRLDLRRIYHAGARDLRIETDRSGPAAVHWTDRRGQAHTQVCDMVAMGWHLQAETQLADLAGAEFAWSQTWSQWLPKTDALGRAAQGVYLAGDGLRLLGADGAEIAGRLAAAACLLDLGLAAPQVAKDLRRQTRMQRFAAGVARAFPWPQDQLRALPEDAVLCRCEGVSVAQMRASLPQSGAEANRVKSLSRVGMGRCQGRYCQRAAAQIIADETGISCADVGRLRAQPPVRPAPISQLLRDPSEPQG